MADSVDASTLESQKDIGTQPSDIVAYWLSQRELSRKELTPWHKRGRKILKRFRDERPQSATSGGQKFNALWANIQVLKPVLYAHTPKPDIAPRWINTDEEVVRVAASILQRSLTYICDRHDIDGVLRASVEDRLLPGMGVARVRYEPTFGEEQVDPTDPAKTFRPVDDEKVSWAHIFWEDMSWSPARCWEEVNWLCFDSYMTRDELVDRFGPKIGKKVTLDYTPKGMEKEDELPPDLFKKATVYEFWNKAKRQVVWIAKEYKDGPLDTVSDPLEVDGFYPCPKPLFATTTTDRMVPVPDFAQYQDQADQLDIIAQRIDKLTRALRVAGVYAASEKATLNQLLTSEGDNQLVPVEDWAVFAQQKGGLEGTILWVPIQVIAGVLKELYAAFDRQKELLYEISGLSDIMRGATKPEETFGAQRLKSQYGTIRTTDSQKDVGRFARDLFRLAGQIVSKHLDPAKISEITGLPELPEPVQQPTPPMPQMPAMQPMAASNAGLAAPQPGVPQPQAAPDQSAPPIAPAAQPMPPQSPLPAMAAPGTGAQPGAGGPAMGGSPPPAPHAPISAPADASGAPTDPMAKYQQDLKAFNDYQAEVKQKTDQFQAACALLKQDALRTFRLDIEADSTIAADQDAEQQARVQFVTAIGTLLQQAVPFVQQMPKAGGALMAEILKFVTHGFRAGRSMVETIDKFADQLDELPEAPPKTDPGLAKVQADTQLGQARLQLEGQQGAQKLQQEDQHGQQKLQIDDQHGKLRIANDAEAMKTKAALEAQEQENDLRVKLAGVAADERVRTHVATLEHHRKREQLAADDLFKRQAFDKDHALEREKTAAKAQAEKAANDAKPPAENVA